MLDEALDNALTKKSLPALKKALVTKPDLNALDSSGKSPLHRAVQFKKLELAEALLEAGASLDVKDDDDSTPLHTLLVGKSGAMNDQELTNARWLISKGAGLNVTGNYGRTSLHFAAAGAPIDLFRELIAGGAKVSRDKAGNTPLKYCLSTNAKDEATWELLLQNGCSLTERSLAGHAASPRGGQRQHQGGHVPAREGRRQGSARREGADAARVRDHLQQPEDREAAAG